MITYRRSRWNVPGFLRAEPNAGLRMLHRLPLRAGPGDARPHGESSLLKCTPVAPKRSRSVGVR